MGKTSLLKADTPVKIVSILKNLFEHLVRIRSMLLRLLRFFDQLRLLLLLCNAC